MSDIDDLLRRTMEGPVPRLSSDFDERLSRELRRRSRPPKKHGWILLGGYGGVSAMVSMVVMHGQGLGWGAVAVMTIGTAATGLLIFLTRARI